MKTLSKLSTLLMLLLATQSIATRANAAPSDMDYFKQFLFNETDDADGNPSTRFLMAFGIPVATNGTSQVIADVELFLMSDGTYKIKYSESNEKGFPIAMRLPFTGTWSVPADQLIVGDVGTGARGIYQGRNAVNLTFTKDLNTPGLSGKSALFDLGFSNEKPNDP